MSIHCNISTYGSLVIDEEVSFTLMHFFYYIIIQNMTQLKLL